MSCSGCSTNINTSRPAMLDTYNWLNDLPDTTHVSNIVEVRFKSTRKEYCVNTNNLPLKMGSMVVVASSPGHDVGYVTLTGYLAEKQFNRKIKNKDRYILNTIYRKVTDLDFDKWKAAQKKEKPTMIRAREIAKELGLAMKIGDVEYKGDGAKAIFYYIAEGRVDFRELIKLYAKEFRIRIEMKQIGARQEAGRIGGIGSCGRELCCSSWRTNFDSITIDAIEKQALSSSANKMAGACGKLKCCLLYELDSYVDARKEFPTELLKLDTSKGTAFHLKTDFLAKKIWYTLANESKGQPKVFTLSISEVKSIIQKNKRNIQPDIPEFKEEVVKDTHSFVLKEEKRLPERKKRFNNQRNKNKVVRRKNKVAR